MPYATNDDAEKNGGADAAPRGLTDREVAERLADGRANVNTDVSTKSVPTIVREHVLTLFNGINLFLALVVASTGQYRNLLFMLVVLANLVIGVFQEVRSKLTIDRLSILAERPVRVVRASGEAEVAASELVLDDLVRLSHGDQVPADSVILTGDVLMDESLLTGESRLVRKVAGDELLSGSFVSSGSLLARVTRVGADGFAAKINAEAKYVKPVRSEILETLRMIIRLGTSVLLPRAALFARTLLDGATPQSAALTTVAAVVGMIPQGLVLLTSTVLAIATTRLARSSVLVQQLYCIETLARVDVLCLDKTGTITTGAMEVSSLLPETPNAEDDLLRVLGLVARANEADANDTSRAIAARVPAELLTGEKIVRVVPFSSARKYSGCVLADGTCLVMGASQFVLGDAFAAHEAAVPVRLARARARGLRSMAWTTAAPSWAPRASSVFCRHPRPGPRHRRPTVAYFRRAGVTQCHLGRRPRDRLGHRRERRRSRRRALGRRHDPGHPREARPRRRRLPCVRTRDPPAEARARPHPAGGRRHRRHDG